MPRSANVCPRNRVRYMDDLEKMIHDVGHRIEEETGVDLDWEDDVNHLAKEAADEFCKLMGKEAGKNCHINAGIAVNNEGKVVLLDGAGRPVEARDDENVIYVRNIPITVTDQDLVLDRANLRTVLVGALASGSPAEQLGIGPLFDFVNERMELDGLGREHRKMEFALTMYAKTIPRGARVKVKALFAGKKFVSAYAADQPTWLEPDFKDFGLYDIVSMKV